MKRFVRNAFALVLCLALCLTLLPVSFAAHTEKNAAPAINETNFPDKAFRDFVKQECDWDGDGSLSDTEISGIFSMECPGKGIGSLKGIEYFVEVQMLYVQGNKLTSLDLSELKKLTILNCSNNRLTKLKLAPGGFLSTLNCENNSLTSLALGKQSGLSGVNCSNNSITKLDLSNCNALSWLKCKGNKLSEIKLSGAASIQQLETDRGVKIIYTLPAPILRGHIGGDKPMIDWDYEGNVDAFQIWRSTTGKSSGFKRVKTVSGDLFAWDNLKAKPGTTYWYKVRATLKDGTKSSFSNVVKLTTPKKPATPKLTASLNEKGKPVLKWNYVKNAGSYQLWRSTTGEPGSFKRIIAFSGNTWTDTKAKAGTTYYYKVRAVSSHGTKGSYSEVIQVTATPKPAAPEPTVSLNAKGKPVLSWTAVEGAVKYQIWRSTTGEAGSFKRIATVTKTTFTNGKAELGKTYWYKVKAVSAEGLKSGFSPVLRIETK